MTHTQPRFLAFVPQPLQWLVTLLKVHDLVFRVSVLPSSCTHHKGIDGVAGEHVHALFVSENSPPPATTTTTSALLLPL